MTKLNENDLESVATQTLGHYAKLGEGFRERTRDHDVSQNIAALLNRIEGPKPFTILDVGCGPGRDLKSFASLGHRAIGLEGCAEFAAMARAEGSEVWEQNFLSLDPRHPIISTASSPMPPCFIFRAKSYRVSCSSSMPPLKPRGVLFSSNPRGNNDEGWFNGRYCNYHDLDGWRRYLTAAGFEEIEHFYRPAGLPREEQPWLASVWRKK